MTKVGVFSPQDLQRLMRQPRPAVTPKTAARKPDKPKEQKKTERKVPDELGGQMVELTRPPVPVPPPADARYLAQFNTRTERETKKSGTPGQPKPERGRPDQLPEEAPRPRAEQRAVQPPSPPAAPSPPAVARPVPPPPRPRPPATQQGELPRDQEQEPLAMAPPIVPPRAERPAEGSSPPSSLPERLTPRPGSYDDLLPPRVGGEVPPAPGGPVGNRGSDDYLPDLPEGDSLSLNARETKYWSFFHRVRENLRQHWRPAEKYRRRDPWGKVYGVKDRLTVLAVTLDRAGKVQKLDLVQGSGIDFLDDEALEAFRSAESFPNPPPGLIEADGLIHFRFGFAVVRNASDFRMFRYDF